MASIPKEYLNVIIWNSPLQICSRQHKGEEPPQESFRKHHQWLLSFHWPSLAETESRNRKLLTEPVTAHLKLWIFVRKNSDQVMGGCLVDKEQPSGGNFKVSTEDPFSWFWVRTAFHLDMRSSRIFFWNSSQSQVREGKVKSERKKYVIDCSVFYILLL